MSRDIFKVAVDPVLFVRARGGLLASFVGVDEDFPVEAVGSRQRLERHVLADHCLALAGMRHLLAEGSDAEVEAEEALVHFLSGHLVLEGLHHLRMRVQVAAVRLLQSPLAAGLRSVFAPSFLLALAQ